MSSILGRIKQLILLCVLLFTSVIGAKAAVLQVDIWNSKIEILDFSNDEEPQSVKPIIIISSYNPETINVSNNIAQFQDVCDSLGVNNPISVENMNCKSFSARSFAKV